MLDVRGINPLDSVWQASGDDENELALSALEALVAGSIADRRAARAAKDFALRDAIRDRLAAAGITLEDGPTETRWSLT